MDRQKALHVIKSNWPEGRVMLQEALRTLVPEFNESENERIRKQLLNWFKNCCWNSIDNETLKRDDIIAWLEEQDKQKQDVNYPKFNYDDVLALQCCMETIKKSQEDKELYEQLQNLHDRVHDAYWLEKQGNDKLEPMFKVGDKIKLAKEPGYPAREIIAIKNDAYYFDKWVHLPFSHQDEWELVEQGGKGTAEDTCKISDCDEAVDMTEYNNGFECGKQRVLKYPEDYGLCEKPVLSEEDEKMLNSTIEYLNEFREVYQKGAQECIAWLKSLKERMKGE